MPRPPAHSSKPRGSAIGEADAQGLVPPPLPGQPALELPAKKWLCVSEGGAILRAGPDMGSAKAGIVEQYEELTQLEECTLDTGVRRVRCHRGWLSQTAGDGTVILEELAPDDAAAVSPPQIRKMSQDLGAVPAPASPRTRSMRIARDPAQRESQIARFTAERELLLRHSLARLQKTGRLRLPLRQQLGTISSAQLSRVDCQDVLRCLRTGDGLDLTSTLAAGGDDEEGAEEGGDGGEGGQAEGAERPTPDFVLAESQLVMASYETFLLSYNRLQPEGAEAGRLTVQVAEAALRCEGGACVVTLGVGRQTARTTARRRAEDGTCAWEEDLGPFVVSDGCRTVALELSISSPDADAGAQPSWTVGTAQVPLEPLFADGSVDAWYEVAVPGTRESGYRKQRLGKVRLCMDLDSGSSGMRAEVLERIQAAFMVSEVQHDEIVASLTLSDASSADAAHDSISVEMMAKLQLRLQHRLAAPPGVCIGTCPHYRLLLLQDKRPRDFSSDRVFDEWQERQVCVVVNALLALVQRMDNSEREGMVELNESSLLPDVMQSLKDRFKAVIEISHDYQTSAGFPEEEYTQCLDELYDYSMDIYGRHDRSYGLASLRLVDPHAAPGGAPDAEPEAEGEGVGTVPASVWEPFRYPLNTNLYETLCAAGFDRDQVGRHDDLHEDIVKAMERTRVHLGVTSEQQHLCLARQHFDEHIAAEQESRRDTTRNRAAIEDERKEMLSLLQDHVILSTLQDQDLPSLDGSGLVSPAASEAAETKRETQRLRDEVIAPIMEHFRELVLDYHRCDIDLLPRALRVFVALRHPEEPQTVARGMMTEAVVQLYERLSEDWSRPYDAETLGKVVHRVLQAVNVEMEKYQSVWAELLPDSTVLFLRTMGSRVRQDYETGTEVGAIDEHVVRAIHLLQQLQDRMLSAKALDEASVILAHEDARKGGGSPYSKLAWAWIDNHGEQFQTNVQSYVEHESWDAEPASFGASPEARPSQRGTLALTSFSLDALFLLFQEAMDSFFGFAIASDDMFLCLVEHIVSACLWYANGVVESCGDLLDLVPPSPCANRFSRPHPAQALTTAQSCRHVELCQRQKAGVTTTSPPDDSLPSNSSICVRMNNLHEGLQRCVAHLVTQASAVALGTHCLRAALSGL